MERRREPLPYPRLRPGAPRRQFSWQRRAPPRAPVPPAPPPAHTTAPAPGDRARRLSPSIRPRASRPAGFAVRAGPSRDCQLPGGAADGPQTPVPQPNTDTPPLPPALAIAPACRRAAAEMTVRRATPTNAHARRFRRTPLPPRPARTVPPSPPTDGTSTGTPPA